MSMLTSQQEYVPPAGWEPVDIPLFADAPFKVYVNHFKSGSGRMEAFIHNPRKFMLGETVEGFETAGEELKGVRPDSRVQTWITNHENTLQRMILYATAKVENDGSAVSLTLYKHGDGQP